MKRSQDLFVKRHHMAVPANAPQSRAAFTLIDLLVCLAIIAMLVAILLPSLQHAKLVSLRAVCMAHEYEQGKFVERYVQENEGYFPLFQYAVSVKSSSLVMTTKVRSYRASGFDFFDRSVMRCPADLAPGNVRYTDADNLKTMPMSYAFNVDLTLQMRRVHMLGDPSRIVSMYDGSMSGKGDGGFNIEGYYAGSYDFIEHARVNRHLRMTNVLYLDGHVENKMRFLPSQLSPLGGTVLASSWDGRSYLYDDGNNGHGNNTDGVDSTNEGTGQGGPTGSVDPSGDIDDEGKTNNGGKK